MKTIFIESKFSPDFWIVRLIRLQDARQELDMTKLATDFSKSLLKRQGELITICEPPLTESEEKILVARRQRHQEKMKREDAAKAKAQKKVKAAQEKAAAREAKRAAEELSVIHATAQEAIVWAANAAVKKALKRAAKREAQEAQEERAREERMRYAKAIVEKYKRICSWYGGAPLSEEVFNAHFNKRHSAKT